MHLMARKKSGFSRFLGALTGTPYERLNNQIDKLVKENEDDDKKLARQLNKLVDVIKQNYEEESLDEEEHDLLIEAIEEVDPKERTWPKLTDDVDEFYDGDMPDAPELKLGKRKNLDDLMRAGGDEFLGTFGKEEFDEFKNKMAADFYEESDEAVRAGDHYREIRTQNRVFADVRDDVDDVKAKIAEESGLADPNAEEDDGIIVDEDGVEWYEDEEGNWWYRDPGADWEFHGQ